MTSQERVVKYRRHFSILCDVFLLYILKQSIFSLLPEDYCFSVC